MTLNARERQPPVPVADQAHSGRHKQTAHQRSIDSDRQRHAQTQRLHQNHVRRRKAQAHYHHNDRRAGNNTTTALQTERDRGRVIARLPERLLHTRKQENLIVHRQAKERTEEQNGAGGLNKAQRREIQQLVQEAILEDDDQRAIAGQNGERIHDNRLERQDYRAEEQQ